MNLSSGSRSEGRALVSSRAQRIVRKHPGVPPCDRQKRPTNQSTSLSEIFAAAIQDYGRGLVIGQQTYGKGSVQNLYPLDRYAVGPDPGFGQLTVTIGKYYRVTGESTQHRGVQPDITLPSFISTEEVGESTRESALPWDRIKPVDFSRVPGLQQVIPTLEQSHEHRVAEDPEFQALQKEIQSYETVRTQKVVSLNYKTRLAEREQREKERAANAAIVAANPSEGKTPASPTAKAKPAGSAANGDDDAAGDAPDASLANANLAEAVQIVTDYDLTGTQLLSKVKPAEH